MNKFVCVFVAGLSLAFDFSMGQCAYAEQRQPDRMPIHGVVAAPKAFVDYCTRMPSECSSGIMGESRVTLDDKRWAQLDDVNARVNAVIEPSTDLKTYGVKELWALPTNGRGDCEDYALLKRHILIQQGWPVSALLLTIVLDQREEGHAVLSVRTDRGDVVLDNRDNRMLLWHQTGYRFVMRQSFANPMQWMGLGTKPMTATTAVSPRPR